MSDRSAATWTLEELHRLPDDGNRYELVHGELFVTPAPSFAHQEIVDVIAHLLHPYVAMHALGRLRFPRSIIRAGTQSEVEPDLMVRPVSRPRPRDWDDAPLPILVVEVVSATTRRRDYVEKRALYIEQGVPEYWIVNGVHRTIRVTRPGARDADFSTTFVWHPPAATEGLTIDVAALFREALGG